MGNHCIDCDYCGRDTRGLGGVRGCDTQDEADHCGEYKDAVRKSQERNMKDLSEALPLMEQMRANAAKGKAARKQLDLAETAVTTLWAELKTLSDEREILLGKIKEIVNDFE